MLENQIKFEQTVRMRQPRSQKGAEDADSFNWLVIKEIFLKNLDNVLPILAETLNPKDNNPLRSDTSAGRNPNYGVSGP